MLQDFVKDQSGRHQNLAVLVNDVDQLSRVMEDWIHDSMIPGPLALRVTDKPVGAGNPSE